MRHTAHVEFTRAGWRQFLQMNHLLGTRFLKGFILRRELAAYLAGHEERGAALDTTCQELHYGSGIYLLLMKSQGTWYITDIWADEAPVAFSPLFAWQRIKRGWQTFAAKVLIGWRHLTQASNVAMPCSDISKY